MDIDKRNYKVKLVDRLKKDCDVLIRTKIPKALDNISDDKGSNTYRNLTRALADNIKLIEEYDWQLMYCDYTNTTDESNPIRQVSVWEQNSEGEIRNHKVWEVIDSMSSIWSSMHKDARDELVKLISGDEHAPLRQECEDVNLLLYKEWERRFLCEHKEQSGKTVFSVGKDIRNIGKTTFLLSQAKKNSGIYIHRMSSECIRFLSDGTEIRGLGVSDVYACDKANKLYVDEGVDEHITTYIKDVFKEYFIFKTV